MPTKNKEKIQAARLQALGVKSKKEIANMLGVSPNTVHRWNRQKEYRRLVRETMHAPDPDFDKVLRLARFEALETARSLLRNKTPSIRARGCDIILKIPYSDESEVSMGETETFAKFTGWIATVNDIAEEAEDMEIGELDGRECDIKGEIT